MSSTQPPVNRDEIFSALLAASINRFMRRLNTYGSLMDDAERNRGSFRRETAGTAAAARKLDAARRRAVDQAIDDFLAEVPAAAQRTLDQLIIEAALPPSIIDELEDYPQKPKERDAAGIIIGNRALREMLSELAHQFEDDPPASAYLATQLLARGGESPADVLCTALLPDVVAMFEQFLGAMFRSTLGFQPKAFGSLGDISEEVFDRYNNRIVVQAHRVDRKVKELLDGPPSKWQQQILRWLKIDISQPLEEWNRVVESIARRHVVIHNGGLVDEKYLKDAPPRSGGVSIGDPLAAGPPYLREALASYRIVAMVLVLRWAAHFRLADPETVLPGLIDRIYELEVAGDWSAAFNLADAAVTMRGSNENDILQINWWLCHQRLDTFTDQMLTDIQAWQPNDDRSQAAKAALLDDYRELARVLRRIASRPEQLNDMKPMPIFTRAIAQSPEVAGYLTRHASKSAKGRSAQRPRR